jgi:hypothetical protein
LQKVNCPRPVRDIEHAGEGVRPNGACRCSAVYCDQTVKRTGIRASAQGTATAGCRQRVDCIQGMRASVDPRYGPARINRSCH